MELVEIRPCGTAAGCRCCDKDMQYSFFREQRDGSKPDMMFDIYGERIGPSRGKDFLPRFPTHSQEAAYTEKCVILATQGICY